MASTLSSSVNIAISAKRALLRQQTQLLGGELPWLFDPATIPADSLRSSFDLDELPARCLSLAAWMVAEIVRAAWRVSPKLSWDETFELYNVEPEFQVRIQRAVLEPTTRYAPGLFALSEIVAAAPMVAIRESVSMRDWKHIARRAEGFGAKLSVSGTDVQILIRDYLRDRRFPNERVLDPRRLRLDAELGITSVTPIDVLVSAAKSAVVEHIGPANGICVAMQASAPSREHATATMYSAIWSAYTAAADRMIFPEANLRPANVPQESEEDAQFAAAMDQLARERLAELKRRSAMSSRDRAAR